MRITGGGYQNKAVSTQEETGEESDKKNPIVKSSGQFTIRDELLNSTHKFLGLISRTLQQLHIQGLVY